MSSLSSRFSIHLETSPFKAIAAPLEGSNACTLQIIDGLNRPLVVFLPADKLEQVQRIADALNEISKPSAASNPLAA